MKAYFFKLSQFLTLAFSITSCKVTEHKINGVWTSSSSDTLEIHGHHNEFLFTDILNESQKRHTTGFWQKINKGIIFYSHPRPTVKNYTIIKIDSTSRLSTFKIYLANTDIKIPITSAVAYIKEQAPKLFGSLHNTMESFEIDKVYFDKLKLITTDYNEFVFYKTDSTNTDYTVRYYPKDNLYALDKYIFKLRHHKLVGYLESKRTGYVLKKSHN